MDKPRIDSFAAPKPQSSRKFEKHRYESMFRKKDRTTSATNSALYELVKKYAYLRGKSVQAIVERAIASRNQELLAEYFEGMSEEKFILQYPLLPKPPFKNDGKIFNYTIAPQERLVASVLAAGSNLTFADYVNQAVCKVLASSYQ